MYINEGDYYPSGLQVFTDTIIMTGGVIEGNLQLYGSRAEIYGGHITNFVCIDNNVWHGDIISEAFMYGGRVGTSGVGGISAPDLGGKFSWYGGIIEGEVRSGWKNEPSACYHTIYGYDFEIDGEAVTNCVLSYQGFQRHLTGFLQDGTAIDNDLVIYGGSKIELVVVPEPTTLLLIGFGAVILRKRKK
jgi:hypothetical protein